MSKAVQSLQNKCTVVFPVLFYRSLPTTAGFLPLLEVLSFVSHYDCKNNMG